MCTSWFPGERGERGGREVTVIGQQNEGKTNAWRSIDIVSTQ